MADALQLIIPGHERASAEPPESDLSRFLNVKVKKEIAVGLSLRGAPSLAFLAALPEACAPWDICEPSPTPSCGACPASG